MSRHSNVVILVVWNSSRGSLTRWKNCSYSIKFPPPETHPAFHTCIFLFLCSIYSAACHAPFCLFGFVPGSCTVFSAKHTVAEASLLLFNDLSRIENDLEMVLSRFSSTGYRIQPFYSNISAMSLQLSPFPPTSDQAHSRKRKVAGITTGGGNIQNDRPFPACCRTKHSEPAIGAK